MTMLTGRLKKRIQDCKLPDKVLVEAIAFAERGGLNKPPESAPEAPADSTPAPAPETPFNPEAPAAESPERPKRRRGYNRRDMRAE